MFSKIKIKTKEFTYNLNIFRRKNVSSYSDNHIFLFKTYAFLFIFKSYFYNLELTLISSKFICSYRDLSILTRWLFSSISFLIFCLRISLGYILFIFHISFDPKRDDFEHVFSWWVLPIMPGRIYSLIMFSSKSTCSFS